MHSWIQNECFKTKEFQTLCCWWDHTATMWLLHADTIKFFNKNNTIIIKNSTNKVHTIYNSTNSHDPPPTCIYFHKYIISHSKILPQNTIMPNSTCTDVLFSPLYTSPFLNVHYILMSCTSMVPMLWCPIPHVVQNCNIFSYERSNCITFWVYIEGSCH